VISIVDLKRVGYQSSKSCTRWLAVFYFIVKIALQVTFCPLFPSGWSLPSLSDIWFASCFLLHLLSNPQFDPASLSFLSMPHSSPAANLVRWWMLTVREQRIHFESFSIKHLMRYMKFSRILCFSHNFQYNRDADQLHIWVVQRNMYNQMYKLQKSRMITETLLPLYHNLHQFNVITI